MDGVVNGVVDGVVDIVVDEVIGSAHLPIPRPSGMPAQKLLQHWLFALQ